MRRTIPSLTGRKFKIGDRVILRPKTKRTMRALGGRLIRLEGFSPGSPALLAIITGDAPPLVAWISPRELRNLIETARKILR